MAESDIYPLIFTDLDGTLLDHDTYSAEPAATFIETLLKSPNIKVIPVTSKTQAELAILDNKLPFANAIKVSENGSVIKIPLTVSPLGSLKGTIILGASYEFILHTINKLPSKLRQFIKGFADMTANEVADQTGLSLDDAINAKKREATEPFLWLGNDGLMAELKVLMNEANIQIQQGGRFFHFTGSTNKKDAIQTIVSAYKAQSPEIDFKIIALGDGPNDLEMLEAADYGVIIPNRQGASITSTRRHVRIAQKPGPLGWKTSVTDILQELNLI